MLRYVIALAIAISGATAAAGAQRQDQAPGTNPTWTESDTRLASVPARTVFPRRAGPLAFTGTRDLGTNAQLDSTAQYRSADGEIIGSVYVYLPGLAHPGLASFATEQGIRLSSATPARLARRRTVAAGGIQNIAIRDDYENYRDGNASSAAFIKAGRWQIKIRVTGPERRRSDVDAAMDALLGGMEFGRQNPAQAPSPITVSDCPAGEGQRDARLLPDPSGAELAAHAFIGTFDGGGMVATDADGTRVDLPSRVPRELCLSNRIRIGDASVPVLRAAEGPALSVDGRTRLVATLSDSGIWIEVVHAANLGRYVMLFHRIGSTQVLGGYDGVPSDQQIAELLQGPRSEASRVRAEIRLSPGGTDVQLMDPAPTAQPQTTAAAAGAWRTASPR